MRFQIKSDYNDVFHWIKHKNIMLKQTLNILFSNDQLELLIFRIANSLLKIIFIHPNRVLDVDQLEQYKF